ncbi:MAG TPA: kelch repeat-containing protein, partial [Archangium sp.]|nr:kelch repeat-containing protein [Archangium sp.]
TLLRDGRVLVVGGEQEGPSAELYDPATGTWSPTGHGVGGRDFATATLLADGRVLVAGGLERPRPDEDTEDTPAPSSEELYDPATGTWSLTGGMELARGGHSATLLRDGRVLVVGGEHARAEHSSAELYDPATGTWSPASEELIRRDTPMATLLPDGKVLVVGGAWKEAEAELYDPALGTWESAGNTFLPRNGATTTLLLDGTVLVVGGSDPSGQEPYASTELYDPAARSWSPAWSMCAMRVDPSATLLPDGRVLFVGGDTRLGPASAELHDPVTQRWHRTGSLAHQHRSHAAVLLPDGRVLVAGGSSYEDIYYSQERALADAELYDPRTGAWSPAGTLSHARSGPAVTLLRDGKVLLVGGWNPEAQDTPDGTFLTSAELYDPRTGTWSLTTPMAHKHVQPTATRLRDGRVLVV